MKKVLIGFVAILAVAVGVALIAPSFIDWNAYRGEIAAEVRKATGRAFAIDGAIAVSLLPAPELSVRKARLANLKGAHDAEMVRLDALDLRIAFWPLLSGKVVVQSVVLRGADIRLEKLADGRENWSFKEAGAEPAQAVPGMGGGAPVGPARGAGEAISLEQVSIENSTLTYRDSREGTVQHIAGINARIAAGTLLGPFAARGLLRYGGLPLSFELRADRIIEGASTKLNLETGFPEAKARLTYAGYITPGKPSVTLTGILSAEGPDLGALVTTLAQAGASPAKGTGKANTASKDQAKAKPKSRPIPGLARPFRLSANVTGGADQISLKDIAGQFDGTKASGQVAITPGDVTQINGSVKINRLDLDKWLAGSAKAGSETKAKPGKSKTKSGGAQAGLGLPKTLSVSLRAEIGNVVYRKGLAREVSATVGLDKGALQVQSFSARLPGGSKVALTGKVTQKKSGPRFGGKLSLDSNDFRALARWVGADLTSLPRDRLRKVRVRAVVGSAPERIELTKLDIRFDSSRLTGGMVVAMRKRIGIGTRLTLDRINLDAYLPKEAPKGKAGTAPAAAASGIPAPGGLAALAAFDANFNLSVGRLTYGGERISGVKATGTLAGGNLMLKQLVAANLAGAKLEAKGTVKGIDKTPAPDITVDLTANNPRRLLTLAALPMPLPAEDLSPFAVRGRLKSDKKGITADLKLGAGKIDIAAKGRIVGLDGLPRVDLDLSLGHPDFVTFVRLFDAGFTPEQSVRAPLKLAARVSSAGLDLKLEKLEAHLGQTRLAGRASLSLAAVPPVLKGDLSGDEIILDHFLPGPEKAGGAGPGRPPGASGRGKTPASGAPWSDDPIDVGMLKALDADLQIRAKAIAWRRWRVVEPRLDVTLEKGRLAMRRLAGGMLGGSFHMTGGLTAPDKAGEQLEAKFDMDVARMDLKQAMFNAADVDVVKGKVDFKMALTGTGRSSRAIARSLAGQGSLRATDGAVSGFNLTAVNDRLKNLNDGLSLLSLLQSAMAGGSTKFSRLSGNFNVKDGVLRSKDVALEAEGGSGKGTLVVDIGRWMMDGAMQFRLAGNAQAPPFGLRMKGPIDNPRRIIKANELQAWLATRAAGALINQFMGKPKPPQPGPQGAPSQPPPDPRDQFIRGIFDALKKK